MIKKTLIGIVLIGTLFAACGTIKPLEQAEEPATADPYTYTLDDQPVTLEKLAQVVAQGTHLSYFIPSGWDGKTMQAFSTEAGLEAVKAQQDERIGAQGFCVMWQTKTKFFDGVNYTGAKLELGRNTSYMDLAAVNIDGKNWDNDISSVKGVDCGYSYMYDWVNPNIVISPGMDLPAMPLGYDTGPGKSTISAIAVN